MPLDEAPDTTTYSFFHIHMLCLEEFRKVSGKDYKQPDQWKTNTSFLSTSQKTNNPLCAHPRTPSTTILVCSFSQVLLTMSPNTPLSNRGHFFTLTRVKMWAESKAFCRLCSFKNAREDSKRSKYFINDKHGCHWHFPLRSPTWVSEILKIFALFVFQKE